MVPIAVLTTLHFLICPLLVAVVLLQQGRGADMGASFGGGSNTLFGAGGADSFLIKLTTVLAIVFMTTSVLLSMNANRLVNPDGDLFRDASSSNPVSSNPESNDSKSNTPPQTTTTPATDLPTTQPSVLQTQPTGAIEPSVSAETTVTQPPVTAATNVPSEPVAKAVESSAPAPAASSKSEPGKTAQSDKKTPDKKSPEKKQPDKKAEDKKP